MALMFRSCRSTSEKDSYHSNRSCPAASAAPGVQPRRPNPTSSHSAGALTQGPRLRKSSLGAGMEGRVDEEAIRTVTETEKRGGVREKRDGKERGMVSV